MGGSDTATLTYVGLPTITGLNPDSGPLTAGTSVVITGTNFVGLTGASAITFGGTNAQSYTVNSPTQITAVAPAHAAGTVRVQVTTFGSQITADTAADNYEYVAVPSITSLSPAGGPTAGGNAVIITGTDLTTASAVSFGGTAATFAVNPAGTQITATAPAHACRECPGAGDDGGRDYSRHGLRQLHLRGYHQPSPVSIPPPRAHHRRATAWSSTAPICGPLLRYGRELRRHCRSVLCQLVHPDHRDRCPTACRRYRAGAGHHGRGPDSRHRRRRLHV